MKYRRFEDRIIVRIDRGEEIIEKIMEVAVREDLWLASIEALGAVSEFEAGVYDVEERKYYGTTFRGMYEIVSLTGTISEMNGKPYIHAHISCANEKGEVHGGHLNRAVVSATCEMVISVINGRVDRFRDDSIGLNLFDL